MVKRIKLVRTNKGAGALSYQLAYPVGELKLETLKVSLHS